MRRLTAVRWLSTVLMLSGLLGNFPFPARTPTSSHTCCKGARVCHCADHGSQSGAAARMRDGCMLRAAGCAPPSAALSGTPLVLAVLAAGVPLTEPARHAASLQQRREAAQVGASRPDLPPPRFSV